MPNHEQTYYHSKSMAHVNYNSPIFLSSLPGRSRAGSRTSGRLVAMIIFTWPSLSNPSIWFSSSISVRWISRSAEVPSENRRPPIASISSMKMIQGWWSRAYAACVQSGNYDTICTVMKYMYHRNFYHVGGGHTLISFPLTESLHPCPPPPITFQSLYLTLSPFQKYYREQ